MSNPENCYTENGMLYCERKTEKNNSKKKGKNNNGNYRGESSSIDQKEKGSKIKNMTVC